MGRQQRYITGLDIGTTKVCCIIGTYDAHDSSLNILGVGTAINNAMREGLVTDVGATTEAIVEAVAVAEKMANVHVKEVYVGVAGSHITSENRFGSFNVEDPLRGVSARDRREALKRAMPPAQSDDTVRMVLMNIPQEFILDENTTGVVSPIGMSANILKARVHVVYAQRTSLENIRKAIYNAGLSIRDIVLESVASSMALLGEEEKMAGVGLIDIGGGTSDVAVYVNNQIRHSCEIPIGGDAITKAIAEKLRVTFEVAENLKKKYAVAVRQDVSSSKMFTFTDPVTKETRQAQQYYLAEIVETKLEEIFSLALREFEKAGVAGKLTGMVLTGGTSIMPKIERLAQRCFQTDYRAGEYGIRVGEPGPALTGIKTPVQSPICSTCVGLVWYGGIYPNGIGEHAGNADSGWRRMVENLKNALTNW